VTTPQIGFLLRLAGCKQVTLDAPTYYGVVDATTLGDSVVGWRRFAVRAAPAIGAVASAVVRVAGRVSFGATASVEPADRDDAVPYAPSEGGWTVDPTSCWEWLSEVGALRVVAVGGRRPSRVLVRPPRSKQEDLHVIAWDSDRPGTVAAMIAVAHVRRLAGDARTLRVQTWQREHTTAVGRACRLLGMARRPYNGTFYTRTRRPDVGTVAFNPYFYAMF
jgi:hypothetical protein